MSTADVISETVGAVPAEPTSLIKMMDATAAMDFPVAQFIDLPGRGRYCYREVGHVGDKPTVVLVHGMMASGMLNWAMAFELLSKKFHVIAPDLRGCGQSKAHDGKWSLRKCADDLEALLRLKHVDNVIMVGYSMGGAVTETFAQRHPSMVKGIILAATGYRPVTGEGAAKVGKVVLSGVQRLINIFSAVYWLPSLFRKKQIKDAICAKDAMLDDFKRTSVSQQILIAKAMSKHHATWLSDIEVPAVVLATLNDEIFSEAHQREMADLLPQGKLMASEEGHLACVKPAYNKLLVKACKDVERRANEMTSDASQKMSPETV